MTFRHAARTEFLGGKHNFGGAMTSRWRQSQKNKKVFCTKSHHFLQALWWSPKKSLQFGKPPFSATLNIKTNTTLFLSILKLKDLSEIYLGEQITIWGGAIIPLLPLATCLLVTVLWWRHEFKTSFSKKIRRTSTPYQIGVSVTFGLGVRNGEHFCSPCKMALVK